MVSFYGDYNTTETIVIPFNAFSSNDPSASITVTNLASTDVYIYKDGSLTQRTSFAGIAVDIDVDAIVGNHWVTIDLSDDTDAGFYVAGSRYQVRMEGVTIDGATINAWIGAFSIGCTLRPATAGRTLNVANGAAEADLTYIHGSALTETAGQLAGRFVDFFDHAAATFTLNTSLASFKATGFAVAGDLMGLVANAITNAKIANAAFEADAFATNALIAATFAADYLTAIKGEVTSALNTYDPPTNAEMEARTLTAATYATAAKLLAYVQLLARGDEALETDNSAELTEINADGGSGGGSYANDAHSQQATRQHGDQAWLTGGGAGATASYTEDTNWTRTVGDNDGGSASDTTTVNGTTFDTGEVNSTTLLEVDVVFSITDGEIADTVDVWGFYNGGASHFIQVLAKDTASGLFEPLSGVIGNGTAVEKHSFSLSPNHTDTGADTVSIKFRHLQGVTGIGAHVFSVDKAQVNTIVPAPDDFSATQKASINTEVDNALDTAIPGAPTSNSINERIAAMDNLLPYGHFGIWLDTVGGAAGTTPGTNGTRANAVDTLADAVTLAASLGIQEYHLLGASSITLVSAHSNWSFHGQNGATVNLGGVNTNGSHFDCLTVTGDADSNDITARSCKLQSLTNLTGTFEFCLLVDNATLIAGDTYFFQCASAVAGTSTPYIDLDGDDSNARNLHLRGWLGGIELRTHTSTDTTSFDCSAGQIVVAADCTGGTIAMRGNINITDNASGNVTFSQNAAVNMSKINAVAGGDATEAKQDTMIASLTAAKGATFVTGTDSLEAIRNRGDAAWTTGAGGQIGSGAIEWTLKITDTSANPLDGVEVWITTDSAGANVVAGTISTDALGLVTFMLDAGTYYVWRQLAGYDFTNPATTTVA